MPTDRERQTAVHEAGHVVARDELGHEQHFVSIEQDYAEGSAGRAVGEDRAEAFGDGADESVRAEEAVSSYAGHAAVVVVLGRGEMTDESAREHGAEGDLEDVRQLTLSDSALQAARSRAVAIVGDRRDDVELIASALLKHRRLVGQEVDAVLSRDPGFWRQYFPHLFSEE